MVSSGQAFNSLSYCCVERMEPSMAALCCSCLSTCLGPLSWCIPREERGWRMGQDGLQQWMEMWSESWAEGLILQQWYTAHVAAKRQKLCFCKLSLSAAVVLGRHILSKTVKSDQLSAACCVISCVCCAFYEATSSFHCWGCSNHASPHSWGKPQLLWAPRNQRPFLFREKLTILSLPYSFFKWHNSQLTARWDANLVAEFHLSHCLFDYFYQISKCSFGAL